MMSINKTYVLFTILIIIMFSFSNKVLGKYEKIIYDFEIESITGENAVSDLLFNSRVNYSEAFGKKHVMQGSCNVTGMGRILEPLRKKYGSDISRFDVTLIRRWADIEQTDKSITDTIELTQSPHHGEDVKSYLG